LPAVCGAPNIAAKIAYEDAEIEKASGLIGVCYRVAAEGAVLQNAREMPGEAGIGAVTIAGLSERLGIVPSVKLPPADRDLVPVGGIK
jgi:hypothetical protein